MGVMSGVGFPTGGEPRPQPPARPAPEDELFQSLIVTNPQRPESRWGLPASILTHGLLIGLVILVPIFWPTEMPDLGDPLRVLIYNPPAAAAAPLPKGSPDIKKMQTPQKVSRELDPEKPKFEMPTETPKEQPLIPEAGVTVQAGSPNGSDSGIPEGMEGGVEGGVAGGVPGGVVGGCVGCDGDGPVLDYDQGPQLVTQTRPQYPQEAFVKKIEGTVVVEILIDTSGHVHPTRVLRSVFPALDAEARRCVGQWVFKPAVKRGKPVATIATAPIDFRIF